MDLSNYIGLSNLHQFKWTFRLLKYIYHKKFTIEPNWKILDYTTILLNTCFWRLHIPK